MVERSAMALCRADGGNWEYARTRYVNMARSMLTAALGDVEPLEDVLRRGDVSSVDFALNLGLDDNRQVIVASVEANVWILGDNAEGTGPTIDAAIRAAVANARKE